MEWIEEKERVDKHVSRTTWRIVRIARNNIKDGESSRNGPREVRDT